jgi:uncharacterized circularly permuted ATP-grasp superfamily protein
MCQGEHIEIYAVVRYIFISLGGDFLKGDGTGSFSIYGDKFPVGSCSSFFLANGRVAQHILPRTKILLRSTLVPDYFLWFVSSLPMSTQFRSI